MEFLKYLKNEYDTNLLEITYKRAGLKGFDLPQRSKPIIFNKDVILSVQGSFGHYCFPRKTLPYKKYTNMEFAIISGGKFVPVERVLNINTEENEWQSYFDGSVYGYVPIRLIEKLYKMLKATYGLKTPEVV